MAIQELWPLFGLRVETPLLLLRYPSDADLAALASHPADAIHDPATMPFAIPWTDAPPEDRQWVSQTLQEGNYTTADQECLHSLAKSRARTAARFRRS